MKYNVFLPSIHTFVHIDQVNYIKQHGIEYWDLVMCSIDYYVRGTDLNFEAYWQSILMAANTNLDNPAMMFEAKNFLQLADSIRENVYPIYCYIRNTICTLLTNANISTTLANNVTGVSFGPNYICAELSDGAL